MEQFDKASDHFHQHHNFSFPFLGFCSDLDQIPPNTKICPLKQMALAGYLGARAFSMLVQTSVSLLYISQGAPPEWWSPPKTKILLCKLTPAACLLFAWVDAILFQELTTGSNFSTILRYLLCVSSSPIAKMLLPSATAHTLDLGPLRGGTSCYRLESGLYFCTALRRRLFGSTPPMIYKNPWNVAEATYLITCLRGLTHVQESSDG